LLRRLRGRDLESHLRALAPLFVGVLDRDHVQAERVPAHRSPGRRGDANRVLLRAVRREAALRLSVDAQPGGLSGVGGHQPRPPPPSLATAVGNREGGRPAPLRVKANRVRRGGDAEWIWQGSSSITGSAPWANVTLALSLGAPIRT